MRWRSCSCVCTVLIASNKNYIQSLMLPGFFSPFFKAHTFCWFSLVANFIERNSQRVELYHKSVEYTRQQSRSRTLRAGILKISPVNPVQRWRISQIPQRSAYCFWFFLLLLPNDPVRLPEPQVSVYSLHDVMRVAIYKSFIILIPTLLSGGRRAGIRPDVLSKSLLLSLVSRWDPGRVLL